MYFLRDPLPQSCYRTGIVLRSRLKARGYMLIIGCGNRERGDDAAGILVAETLQKFGIEADQCDGEASALLDLWSRADDVIVIDAVTTGVAIGTIHFWDGPPPIKLAKPGSTHSFGVGEAIELARTLERLPTQLRIYGIEGRNFTVGTAVSPEVQKGIEEVVGLIAEELLHPADTAMLSPR